MAGRGSRQAVVRGAVALVLVGAVVVGSASPAVAVTHTELEDAGDLLATAQEPIGTGALTAISGVVSHREDVDLYKICIDSNATFSATTTGTGGTLLDTQLWLFSATGQGVYHNDDDPHPGNTSTLPAGHPSGPGTGTYYLGISAYNTDALTAPSPEGFLVFADAPEGATVGSIDNRTLGGWNDNLDTPLDPKTYTIALTGTQPCTAPAAGTACPASAPAGAILGTSGADRIVGTAGDDVIFALGGDDRVVGLGGNDTIVGGDGLDRLSGGAGKDVLCGGAGPDELAGEGDDDRLEGDIGDDRLDGGPGTNTAIGGAGTDQCANSAVLSECNP